MGMQKGGLGAFETPLKFPREESEANESCQRLSTVIASWEPQKRGCAQKKRRYNIGGIPPTRTPKVGSYNNVFVCAAAAENKPKVP